MSLSLADSPTADPLDEEVERAQAERLLAGAAKLCPIHGFRLDACPLCAQAIAELAASLPEAR